MRVERRGLAAARAIGLAEDEDLQLVVTGKHTSASNGTEDVGTSTLEEGLDTLLLDDLGEGVGRAPVLDGLTGGHHHATTHSVEGVGGQTGSDGDTPTEEEGGQEGVLEVTGEEGLERIVETEVETAVDDDAHARDVETTVETDDAIGLEGLLVDVQETVELTLASLLGGLVVVGETGTGVIERVHEEQRSGTSGTTRGKVTSEPLPVAILVLHIARLRTPSTSEKKK